MVVGDFLQKNKSKKRKSLIAAIGLPLFLLGFAACGKKQPVDSGIPLKELILE